MLTEDKKMEYLKMLLARDSGGIPEKASNDLMSGPAPLVNKKLGERVMADTSSDMMPMKRVGDPDLPMDERALVPSNYSSIESDMDKVASSMGNIEELGKASANVAGYDSISDIPTAGAGSANPGLGVAKIALGVMKAQAAMDEKERQEAHAAQAKTHSNMSSALANLAKIGQSLNLG